MTRCFMKVLLVLVSILPLGGCYDRIDMEDASFSLVIGFDTDGDGNLLIYNSIPVFNKNAKKKSQEIVVRSQSISNSRFKSDAFTSGILQPRKLKVIVVSKSLVSRKEWFRYLDVFFRNGRIPLTCRIMVFDGRLKGLFDYHPKDKPILPLQLLGMLESINMRAATVDTTLQRLHTEMLDKGQTASLPQISINPDLNLSRTALLNSHGLYTLSLTSQEVILLRMLQKDVHRIEMTIPMPERLKDGPGAQDMISFSSDKTKSKIHITHHESRFRFDISVQMTINLSEILFPIDIIKEKNAFELACSNEIRKQLEALMTKLQKNKLDPIGFGDYARAYEYAAFSKVQEHWEDAFQEAEFHLDVKVSLADVGATE